MQRRGPPPRRPPLRAARRPGRPRLAYAVLAVEDLGTPDQRSAVSSVLLLQARSWRPGRWPAPHARPPGGCATGWRLVQGACLGWALAQLAWTWLDLFAAGPWNLLGVSAPATRRSACWSPRAVAARAGPTSHRRAWRRPLALLDAAVAARGGPRCSAGRCRCTTRAAADRLADRLRRRSTSPRHRPCWCCSPLGCGSLSRTTVLLAVGHLRRRRHRPGLPRRRRARHVRHRHPARPRLAARLPGARPSPPQEAARPGGRPRAVAGRRLLLLPYAPVLLAVLESGRAVPVEGRADRFVLVLAAGLVGLAFLRSWWPSPRPPTCSTRWRPARRICCTRPARTR